MLGRTPGNIVAIKPMKDGVIADFEVTEKMLTYFIKKAHNRTVWVRPRIVIGVPSEITQVEKRAVKDSAYRAKASEVLLVEEAMAAAIGAGMPITEPAGSMIVDVGGGTTDIAVISLAGIVYSKAVRVAGNEMDEAIIHVHQEDLQLCSSASAPPRTSRCGSAPRMASTRRCTMEIKGRHLIEGDARRRSRSPTRRFGRRSPRPSTSSSTRSASRSSARRPSSPPTSSTGASCSLAAAPS